MKGSSLNEVLHMKKPALMVFFYKLISTASLGITHMAWGSSLASLQHGLVGQGAAPALLSALLQLREALLLGRLLVPQPLRLCGLPPGLWLWAPNHMHKNVFNKQQVGGAEKWVPASAPPGCCFLVTVYFLRTKALDSMNWKISQESFQKLT